LLLFGQFFIGFFISGFIELLLQCISYADITIATPTTAFTTRTPLIAGIRPAICAIDAALVSDYYYLFLIFQFEVLDRLYEVYIFLTRITANNYVIVTVILGWLRLCLHCCGSAEYTFKKIHPGMFL
jgi:hypothetical protein